MMRGGGGGLLKVILGLGFFLFILAFFFLSAGKVEPVRFNRFWTLETETESNWNFL